MIKKMLLGIFLIVSLVFITACGGYEEEIAPIEFTYEQMQMLELAREDFEFLVELLEGNFPFFGIAYRREGHDIHEFFDAIWSDIEQAIANDNITDIESLIYSMDTIFYYYFEEQLVLAHLTVFPDQERSWFDFGLHEFQAEEEIRIFEASIIEEDKIAYINFWSFASSDMRRIESETRNELFSFLYQVQNYEHLIIDIRGNTGGHNPLALEAFILPNLSEAFESHYFGFFINSPLSENLVQRFHVTRHTQPMFNTLSSAIEFHPAQEIVETYELRYMNQEDLGVLDYAVKLRTNLHPANTEYAFGGQIWLLVNERNFSAAEQFAHVAKITGTMTLVGTTTGGSLAGQGVLIARVALPNTQSVAHFDTVYITDTYGRALEEFRTTPHYFNREGMDALETVLAMIDEMR